MNLLEQRGFLSRYCLSVHALPNYQVNKTISMGLQVRGKSHCRALLLTNSFSLVKAS